MFRRSKNPQAIKGDVIGEALVEVRDQIKYHGWRKGGAYHGGYRPMCLGNAIGTVVQRSETEFSFWGWMHQQAPWLQIPYFQLSRDMVKALGFGSPEELTSWNDHSGHFGQTKVLNRINEGIENRNRVVINMAHEAALAENAEREKLYVPSEWKPRTVSGEQREKVTV